MAQLHWPQTSLLTRHSTSQLEDHRYHQESSSMKLLKTTYRQSADVYQIKEEHEQTKKLLPKSSTATKDLEPIYDGLISLDEIRLAKMIETDLISSNC